MTDSVNYSKNKNDKSIFFPLLIIFIGVILLLSTLDMVPGNGWDLLVRLWPIFFVFGALDDVLNRNWIGAIFNLGLGGILILANFNFFPMSTWQIILNFWPVAVIAVGLQVIFKRQSIIGSLLGVIFAILLVFGLFWFVIQSPTTNNGVSYPIDYESQEVNLVELTVKPLVGNLNIIAGSNPDKLITGEIYAANDEEILKESEVQSQTQEITISRSGNVYFPSKNMNNGFPWNLELNPDMPFSLNIEHIIGVQRLDLSQLVVNKLNSELVIGTMEVILSEDENFDAFMSVLSVRWF
jgi:hypothetical protein